MQCKTSEFCFFPVKGVIYPLSQNSDEGHCYSKSDTLLAVIYEDFISLELYYCWSTEGFGCESRCDQTFESEGSARYQLSRQFRCLSMLCGQAEVPELLLLLRLATINQKISNPQFLVVSPVRVEGDTGNAFCV